MSNSSRFVLHRTRTEGNALIITAIRVFSERLQNPLLFDIITIKMKGSNCLKEKVSRW